MSRVMPVLCLLYLQAKNWIDKETMAVFIEFSVWNPAFNMMSVVQLVLERTLVGDLVKHSSYVKTHRIIYHSTPEEIFLSIMRVAHAMLVFIYARHLVYASLEQNTLLDMMHYWITKTKMEFVILTSAGLSWLSCVLKMYAEAYIKSDFIARDKTGFLNWYDAVYYSEWYANFQGICLFATMCNVLQLPLFFRFTHIIGQSLLILWKMALWAVVCLCGLVMSGYLRFTDESKSFRGIMDTLLFIFGMAIRELQFENLVTNCSYEWHVIFYLSCVMCYMWFLIFPIIKMVLCSVMSMYR
jgi:hypothetical protein